MRGCGNACWRPSIRRRAHDGKQRRRSACCRTRRVAAGKMDGVLLRGGLRRVQLRNSGAPPEHGCTSVRSRLLLVPTDIPAGTGSAHNSTIQLQCPKWPLHRLPRVVQRIRSVMPVRVPLPMRMECRAQRPPHGASRQETPRLRGFDAAREPGSRHTPGDPGARKANALRMTFCMCDPRHDNGRITPAVVVDGHGRRSRRMRQGWVPPPAGPVHSPGVVRQRSRSPSRSPMPLASTCERARPPWPPWLP